MSVSQPARTVVQAIEDEIRNNPRARSAKLRAAEPVLPPRLFKNRVFSATSAVGLVVGFALFGSVTYLPLFLQVVNGASPTGSGLQILPLMGGLLVTSIGSFASHSRWALQHAITVIQPRLQLRTIAPNLSQRRPINRRPLSSKIRQPPPIWLR